LCKDIFTPQLHRDKIIAILSHIFKHAALRAITAYQRHLSPRKGFSCAHRVGTGGASCSAHGYRVIERCGLWMGLALLRRRLRACGELQRRRAGGRVGPRPFNAQAGFCDPSCEAGDCEFSGSDCGDCFEDFSCGREYTCADLRNCGCNPWRRASRPVKEKSLSPRARSKAGARKKVNLNKAPPAASDQDLPPAGGA